MSYAYKILDSLIVDTNYFLTGINTTEIDNTTLTSVGTITTITHPYSGITTVSNTTLSFGASVGVGNGKIVITDPTYQYGTISTVGAAFIYDLDGNLERRASPVGFGTDTQHLTGSASNEINYSGNRDYGINVAVGCGRIVVDANGGDTGVGIGTYRILCTHTLQGSNYEQLEASPGTQRKDFHTKDGLAIGSGRIVSSSSGKSSEDYVNIDPNNVVSDSYSPVPNFGSQASGTLTEVLATGLTGFKRISISASYSWAGQTSAAVRQSVYVRDSLNNIIDFQDGGGVSGTLNFSASNLNPTEIYNIYAEAEWNNLGLFQTIDPSITVTWDGFDTVGEKGDIRVDIYDLDGRIINFFGTGENSTLVSEPNVPCPIAIGFNIIAVGFPNADIGSKVSQGKVRTFDMYGNPLRSIIASDGAAGDNFGHSLAIGEGKLVVGTGKTDAAGKAYIYDLKASYDGVFSSNNPPEVVSDEIKILGESINFGKKVAVGNARIAIGSTSYNNSRGAVYLYDLEGNLLETITDFSGIDNSWYGYDIAIGNGRVVVAPYMINRSFSDIVSNPVYVFRIPDQKHFLTKLDGR